MPVLRNARLAAGGPGGVLRDLDAGGPPGTVDLRGAWVSPGFREGHAHLSGGALERRRLGLRAARSIGEVLDAVRTEAGRRPRGAWIRGSGWDQARWGGAWPEAGALDAAAPDHPVLLLRVDGHVGWVNAAGAAALGTGAGLLVEEDLDRARARLPEESEAERRAALLPVLEEAAALGIVAACDVAEPWAVPLYAGLEAEGALPFPVAVWLTEMREDLRAAHPGRVGTLKIFVDGTLGARTAALDAPYADDRSSRGILRVDPGDLAERVRAAHAAGWSVALHAIGDAAVGAALDALDALPAGGPVHRVEHVQVARPADLARLGRPGRLASIQPTHLDDDAPWVVARLGPDRAARSYPWRSLLSAGARVVGGSDWPVAPLDPRRGLAALGREAIPGRREALDPGAALAVMTGGGDLRALAVWSADPREIVRTGDPEAARVTGTWVGGRAR